MESVRMDEEAVLKTVGPKGSGVRFPRSPQSLLESWQSGNAVVC